MKNAEANENIKRLKPEKNNTQRYVHSLQQRVEHYKKENDILLALSDDITRVREKNDLLILFKKRIKGLLYLTHTIVTLIDHKDETYVPFLLDNESSPIRSHASDQEMVHSRFSLNEPFIQAVLHAEEPISFLLHDIMDQPKSPA